MYLNVPTRIGRDTTGLSRYTCSVRKKSLCWLTYLHMSSRSWPNISAMYSFRIHIRSLFRPLPLQTLVTAIVFNSSHLCSSKILGRRMRPSMRAQKRSYRLYPSQLALPENDENTLQAVRNRIRMQCAHSRTAKHPFSVPPRSHLGTRAAPEIWSNAVVLLVNPIYSGNSN